VVGITIETVPGFAVPGSIEAVAVMVAPGAFALVAGVEALPAIIEAVAVMVAPETLTFPPAEADPARIEAFAVRV
jgi:hypothetical protein